MKTEIKTPILPENTSDAKVIHIYVNEGQQVTCNQQLFDIETDKVVLEVVSPSAGVIENISIAENAHVFSEQLAMNLREMEEPEKPVDSPDINDIETIVEKKVKDDSEMIALEQVIGKSLFDKRGMICGLLGMMVGIIIGAIGAVIIWV
ncbi:biotin/lipoyl-containing protein [Agaribacter flavus]|uniref:Biotin/lipoyl-containing protein n=1 Tax=Agaribacter flavus TaxID=1902781 RepID=A0ABV7FLR3_9ALTE